VLLADVLQHLHDVDFDADEAHASAEAAIAAPIAEAVAPTPEEPRGCCSCLGVHRGNAHFPLDAGCRWDLWVGQLSPLYPSGLACAA